MTASLGSTYYTDIILLGRDFQPAGPPAQILEMGAFLHATEGEMVCESINPKVPYFNAPIYNANKTPVGKVDEVLGPINQVFFTIKPQEGIVATSFKAGDKFFIGGDKLLPLEKCASAPSAVCTHAALTIKQISAKAKATTRHAKTEASRRRITRWPHAWRTGWW